MYAYENGSSWVYGSCYIPQSAKGQQLGSQGEGCVRPAGQNTEIARLVNGKWLGTLFSHRDITVTRQAGPT